MAKGLNSKVRIRGIYSTALTYILLHHKELSKPHRITKELLHDHDFQIVQPSIAQQERFGLERREEPPDLDVHDRSDRQGVQALGEAEPLNAFISILRVLLDDIIVRRWKVAIDLNAKKSIPGKYAVLIPGCQVKISRKIRDRQTRFRLRKLGEELATSRWGILWRTAAADQPPHVLRNEVADLTKKWQDIAGGVVGLEAPAMLWEGSRYADLEFPALSKKKLDEVRGFVAPTINGHHFYKACGGRVSSALEMAEKLLEKGNSQEEVGELFEQTVGAEYPMRGSLIEVEHVKLDGRVFHLGMARIEDLDGDLSLIRFRRVFEKGGTYDGLGTRKEPGDYAITEARVGEWHFKTRYFSSGGCYKGTYVNLNTPIELYPYGIRYVDLEVDVCVWPDGRVKKLDEEKLGRAFAEGLITEKLAEIVGEKIRGLMKELTGFL